MHKCQIERTFDRVWQYEDGTQRQINFGLKGEIIEFVNPSGSHWKKTEMETWQVLDMRGKELPASPIEANVHLDPDWNLTIEQHAPFKFKFRQNAQGDYILEEDSGTVETWNAKERKKIAYCSDGSIIFMHYIIDENGELKCTKATISQAGKLDNFYPTEAAEFEHPI